MARELVSSPRGGLVQAVHLSSLTPEGLLAAVQDFVSNADTRCLSLRLAEPYENYRILVFGGDPLVVQLNQLYRAEE